MIVCIDLLQLHYYQLKHVGGASVDNPDRGRRIRASLLIIIMNDSNINLYFILSALSRSDSTNRLLVNGIHYIPLSSVRR